MEFVEMIISYLEFVVKIIWLNGGLLVQLKIPDEMDSSGIKKAIEKAGKLLGSFRPVKKVPICSNCGLKEEKIAEKCPVCKSPYILA
ncbi:MAG: hypothetical protein ACREA7_07750 [Nitrosotalea sp.]